MKYIPHDYQKAAEDFILTHKIACLLLDMGLGKTVITLTAVKKLLDEGKAGRVLVIAPLRVAKVTWPEEIEKWDHLKGLTYSVITGPVKEREKAMEQDADIHIVNRENLQWMVEKSDGVFDYDMVIIDELSSFKNYSSKRFKAFMQIRPRVKRVVGLTGTPAPNGLMDLFAEYKCLDMGARLGRFISKYRFEYFYPDKMNGQIVYSYKLQPGAAKRIYSRIEDITISMKAMDYLKMPELISTKYPVYMSANEAGCYEEFKRAYVIDLDENDEVTAANAAVLTGKLMQMANGCAYTDNGGIVTLHDRKLDALEDIIEAANGRPVLVAYWFRSDLERIRARLDRLKIKFAEIRSDESITAWNAGELTVGLIHPASAGHGLNLQSGGNHIVWFGLTWSLELYQQTNARLWRQGQKEGTVVVQHIITAGTIDENISDALIEKKLAQNDLIQAVKAQL